MKKIFFTCILASTMFLNVATPAAAHTPNAPTTSVASKGQNKKVVILLKDGRKAVILVKYGSAIINNAYTKTGSRTLKSSLSFEGRIYSSNGVNYKPLDLNKNYFLLQKVASLLNIDLAH